MTPTVRMPALFAAAAAAAPVLAAAPGADAGQQSRAIKALSVDEVEACLAGCLAGNTVI